MITTRGLRQVSKLQNGPALSDVLERFMAWCKPPKGFEKFFCDKPKAGEKSEAPKQKARSASNDKQIPRPNLNNKPSQNQSSTNNYFQELFKKFSGSGGSGAGGG